MSIRGTTAHDGIDDLPPLVARAVRAAHSQGFDNSCHPGQGALLAVLASGVGPGLIGETGTGCGVGLAWLASRAHPAARLVSVERDPGRSAVAAALFQDNQAVTVSTGDWTMLRDLGPFDLLVLDGGGSGKAEGGGGEPPLDPRAWLRPGGLVVIDDFSPSSGWPPRHGGAVDTIRVYWLRHPCLQTAEVRTGPDAVTLVGSLITP